MLKYLKICTATCLAAIAHIAAADTLDRSVLPIPEPVRPTYNEMDVRTVAVPPAFDVRAPAGAPNVVIVLIDDLGFGAPGTFGGPIPTPTLDRLAAAGLRYDNFHTAALCSPTRAALKSGRNHHTVNIALSPRWPPPSRATPAAFRTQPPRSPKSCG
jgi:arylsulfatase